MSQSLLGVPLDLAEVADRYAITELLNYHSRALDRRDADLMKEVYWSDAEVDYGGFKGKAHDFAPLAKSDTPRPKRTYLLVSDAIRDRDDQLVDPC